MMKPAQVRHGSAPVAEPRIVSGDEIIVAGLAEKRNLSEVGSIPAQWQKFITSYHADIPDKAKEPPLSVTACMDNDGNFIYLCGSAVTRPVTLAKGLTLTKVPPQTYAVFLHSRHVSAIGSTYAAIFDKWLPENNRTMSGGPSLEKNMPTFDRKTGLGGIEIWIPLAA